MLILRVIFPQIFLQTCSNSQFSLFPTFIWTVNIPMKVKEFVEQFWKHLLIILCSIQMKLCHPVFVLSIIKVPNRVLVSIFTERWLMLYGLISILKGHFGYALFSDVPYAGEFAWFWEGIQQKVLLRCSFMELIWVLLLEPNDFFL